MAGWRIREGITSPESSSSASRWSEGLTTGDGVVLCNGESGHGELVEAVVPESEAVSSSQLEDSSSSSSVVYGELGAFAGGRVPR